MQKIIFYTTFGCHLCEKVEQMFSYYFSQNKDNFSFEIELFDIIDDEKILEDYRTKIPVLKKIESKKNYSNELCWPFEYSELCEWLES